MINTYSIIVYGEAIPKGSTRAFVINGKAVTTNANKRTKDWQTLVSMAAQEKKPDKPIDGAVDILLNFYLPRPKGHYGTGKNAGKLRESAPDFHVTKPDTDKLARAVKDGLTGVVYGDDSQVTQLIAVKWYASPMHACGVEVEAVQLTA